ncbi:MAG: hypothetical protein K8F91_13280 [Candidatus Obscuribacterales bacterium]|nr:hypothetical protein [Candidatus Obscuribacterales bacterium]
MRDRKKRIALGRNKDVYFACICALGVRCHREILMLLARELYGSDIGEVFYSYLEFMEKL